MSDYLSVHASYARALHRRVDPTLPVAVRLRVREAGAVARQRSRVAHGLARAPIFDDGVQVHAVPMLDTGVAVLDVVEVAKLRARVVRMTARRRPGRFAGDSAVLLINISQ
jgi:hypothetical protein